MNALQDISFQLVSIPTSNEVEYQEIHSLQETILEILKKEKDTEKEVEYIGILLKCLDRLENIYIKYPMAFAEITKMQEIKRKLLKSIKPDLQQKIKKLYTWELYPLSSPPLNKIDTFIFDMYTLFGASLNFALKQDVKMISPYIQISFDTDEYVFYKNNRGYIDENCSIASITKEMIDKFDYIQRIKNEDIKNVDLRISYSPDLEQQDIDNQALNKNIYFVLNDTYIANLPADTFAKSRYEKKINWLFAQKTSNGIFEPELLHKNISKKITYQDIMNKSVTTKKWKQEYFNILQKIIPRAVFYKNKFDRSASENEKAEEFIKKAKILSVNLFTKTILYHQGRISVYEFNNNINEGLKYNNDNNFIMETFIDAENIITEKNIFEIKNKNFCKNNKEIYVFFYSEISKFIEKLINILKRKSTTTEEADELFDENSIFSYAHHVIN